MLEWNYIKRKLKRINQLLLVWPVWLVLGFSYLLSSHEKENGWIESTKNTNWEKMY